MSKDHSSNNLATRCEKHLEKTLMLGKIEGRRRGHQRTRGLECITNSMDMSLSKLWEMVKTEKPAVLQSMGLQSWTRLSD